MRTLLLLPFLLVASFLLLPEANSVGHTTLPLEFLVVDAATGRPVPGSLVQLKGATPEYKAPLTDRDGRAKLVIQAMCGGRSSLFRSTRNVQYGEWEVSTESAGYETYRAGLSQFTHDHRYHDRDAVPPPIIIRIMPRSPGRPVKSLSVPDPHGPTP
jgi:hypothetical protein